MDTPLNTHLRRKTWNGSESTKDKENSFSICESCKALIHDCNQCNNPARSRREMAELTNLSRNDVPQQYEMKERKRKRTQKRGSDLNPHGKHKKSGTKKATSLLSELMFNQDHAIPRVKHKQTQTEITVDDESAAGSSITNSESEEIVTRSIMKSETMPDDYKLQETSGSSGLCSRSCLLPCSHSMVSLSKIPCTNNNFTQVNSSPDVLLNEFTPVITDDFDDETYLFQCSCPGLYQCSVTGLVFLMKGEGDVVYRTVPWNRKLLAQHHKKPAGPLFDIKCQQQSVCQLCLPHCEIISTGGGQFLQVAHVKDEGIEFITPQRITESHVIINITGFSGYGIVSDKDSPPDPVQALVLLFYKLPVDPDLRSILSVLLLPRNIVIRDVQRTRRKLNGDERYIDTSPHCKLHPKQFYTLSTVPEDNLIKVEPEKADFDDEYYDSYFTSFQVILRRSLTDVNLSLKDKSSSTCVWERDVCLFSPTVGALNRPPSQRLKNTRSCFIEGISGPVLSSLIDKLLEKTVITDAEREEADAMKNKREKARFVIDTVRSKGDDASSEFINFLRDGLKLTLEQFAAKCEAAGMRINTSKSDAMALSWCYVPTPRHPAVSLKSAPSPPLRPRSRGGQPGAVAQTRRGELFFTPAPRRRGPTARLPGSHSRGPAGASPFEHPRCRGAGVSDGQQSPVASPLSTLVLGDSIVRNVRMRGALTLSFPGATVVHIVDRIPNILASHPQANRLIIHIGTNDIPKQ
ncbi:uncharacterized protein LOC134638261 [Pelmatolapia mariae]|uniref:uncharacterized protein LOC134638261 n=1 Tax=Pelmatolapia mariae TaxID=158779 RepID=UPI002FE5CB2B